MQVKLKLVVFGLCVFAFSHTCAQEKKDSVRVLKEVIVEQSRLNNYAISSYTISVDSLTRALNSAGSLGELLRKSGLLRINSYGPGGLTTASIRGTGSNHTAILWNGINLVSPLTGQADLSLVPVAFVDDASIKAGGSASLYGSGSIGGTISLNNKAAFDEGLKIRTFTNIGSFGTYFQDAGVSWSTKKFATSTKAFFTQSANDFSFLNKNVYPFRTDRRQHAGFDQRGVLQQFYWHVTPRDLVTAKLWYQDNFYNTPNATSTPRPSLATERDTYTRMLAGWNHTMGKIDLNYQGAFIHHNLDYRDPSINLISPSIFNTSINNLECNVPFPNEASLTMGINYTWEQGKVADFGSTVPVRNRLAWFTAIKWKPISRLAFAASFREELANGDAKPFAPSITAKVFVSRRIETYVTLSRNYRIPTFNELYWRGAGALGDPTLKSEISTGGEVGASGSWPLDEQSSSLLSLKAAAFSNHVDNWIQWNQVGATVWSPQNLLKVWSRGAEAQVNVQRKFDHMSVDLFLQYNFSKVTNERLYENANDNQLNKQLTLTPLHQGTATLRAAWKTFYLNIANAYTGKQYTDADNSEYFALPAYHVTSIWLSKPFDVQRVKLTVSGEVNNVFDTNYQARQGYPMPGRNFKIGLTIQFIKPNSI